MTTDDFIVFDIEFVGEPWSGTLVSCIARRGDDVTDLSEPEKLRSWLAEPGVPKVTHTQTDSRWLRLLGWTVVGPFHDTQVMGHTLNENQALDLESMCVKYTGHRPPKLIKRVGGRIMFTCANGGLVPLEEAPKEEVWWYNRSDVDATRTLYLTLRQQLEDTGWLDYYLREKVPVTEVVLDMMCNGLPIDLTRAKDLEVELEAESETLQKQLRVDASLPPSFNLDSGDQLAAYLFSKRFELRDALEVAPQVRDCWKDKAHEHGPEHFQPPKGFFPGKVGRRYVHGIWNLKGRGLKRTPKSEKKDRPSTSTKLLLAMHADDPWVRTLARRRRIQKVLTTYLRTYPRYTHDGRLYGTFNQTGTKTGRLSSAKPNLQNQPAAGAHPIYGELGARIRGLFTGHLVVGDYSQLEPRLMAHFSQDPVLLDAYRSGKDVYNITGTAIFGKEVTKETKDLRDISKLVFLGDQYGMGHKELATRLSFYGYPTKPDRAKEYQRELHKLYVVQQGWKEAVMARVKRTGYVVTLGGRHRRLKHQFTESWNWRQVGYGERQAVNAIIQGSAGDIVERLMVCWRRWLPLDNPDYDLLLLAQVHDELVWELPETFPHDDWNYLSGQLEQAACEGHGFDLAVPLVFEPTYARSWAEKDGPIELEEDE